MNLNAITQDMKLETFTGMPGRIVEFQISYDLKVTKETVQSYHQTNRVFLPFFGISRQFYCHEHCDYLPVTDFLLGNIQHFQC